MKIDQPDSNVASSIVINTTTVTGGTPGSVLFVGAGSVIAQDNSNFFWDDTLNTLGIGTATPTAKLDIVAGSIPSTKNALSITGTLANVVGTQTGILANISTTGSTASALFAMDLTLAAGYTGALSGGLSVGNLVAGTNASLAFTENGTFGNVGIWSYCVATTVGTRMALRGSASGGSVNFGVFGQSVATKNSATNIGVAGYALNAGSSPVQLAGYFGLHPSATTVTFASAALMADNGATTSDIFVARDNGTGIFTIADGGVITHAVGTLASTVKAYTTTATLSSTNAVQTGITTTITSAGSGASAIQTAHAITLGAGYTGGNFTFGLNVTNSAAGTGASLFTDGKANNAGAFTCNATTTGTNVGVSGTAFGGDLNIGVAFFATTAKNAATNIGVVGIGRNTGSTPVQLGGYFGLNGGAPTFASAALMCDNSDQTSDIFVARDNGTAIFKIVDGGGMLYQNFVSAKATTPVAVASTDSGTYYTNEGASAKIVFNLPTAAANITYTFIVQDSDGIDITANTGDTIRFAGTVTAAAGTITSTTIGSTITLVAINSTEWLATSLVGTWA